jgi:hypothetical protein
MLHELIPQDKKIASFLLQLPIKSMDKIFEKSTRARKSGPALSAFLFQDGANRTHTTQTICFIAEERLGTARLARKAQ